MNGGFDPHNRLSAAAFFVSISSSTLERCVVPDIQGFGITPGRENDAIALVAQRIERRFPKPGAAGPTPAGGTSAAFDGLALSKNRNHWSPDRPPL